jgi:hypothetical protein
MVFDADGVITAVPFDQIARIEKSSHRLRNGALAGLISGAGLGLGIWAGACSESGDGEDAVFLALATGVWAGIGAGAGVGIGALVNMAKKPGDVLYDAPRRITMSVAPILSKTQKGVALSLTWR